MAQKWRRDSRVFSKFLLFISLATAPCSFAATPGNYTHSPTRLTHLVHLDFSTVDQLKTFKKAGNTSSLLLQITDEYLEDFANCTNSDPSEAEYAEQVITNPLSRFKLIGRIVRFFKVLQLEGMDEIPGKILCISATHLFNPLIAKSQFIFSHF